MKLLALVLACALTLTSLVSGCQRLHWSCNADEPCCGEGVDLECRNFVCREIHTCQREGWCCGYGCYGLDFATCCDGLVCTPDPYTGGCYPATQLRGAIKAIKFVTEDSDTCKAEGTTCGHFPGVDDCCPGLDCVESMNGGRLCHDCSNTSWC